MTAQEQIDFKRIARAIAYIKTHYKSRPSLGEIAEYLHMSSYHFQRMFTDWAGVSPKKFIQYLSIGYAKRLLQDKQATLFDTALETGLSGTGRLHDLFVNIEGMTPGEFKSGGENLSINYSFAESPFGNIIVASTSKGICHMAFYGDGENDLSGNNSKGRGKNLAGTCNDTWASEDDHERRGDRQDDQKSKDAALLQLQKRFPNANYRQVVDSIQQNALFIFQHDWSQLDQIKLHLNATPFQLKVWEALLKIPMGDVSTYGTIAKEIGKPKASRAVGTAIGTNPVAFLIPCHRVIRASGNLGGYMWGDTRKSALIGWEAARRNGE
ncbi:methylated-DNA--[protein]-cysteine S-methyltransferase [Pricia sp. S334]|uniref:Methylated-DNA--[protein]-cysteine S-methyltransferase n=1 Tax=Pricia mediterranea TaxID=3076079 RepID=A0ABU3L198_9FLAO|nr:methylated-DNA--[protein]-cysteine S-methyltransferase [Pricia sp. S334]MDT7827509.1 methylated-DNA--[protein]-cysteine S-methyltransferase [Pricia sp. S334]